MADWSSAWVGRVVLASVAEALETPSRLALKVNTTAPIRERRPNIDYTPINLFHSNKQILKWQA